MNVDSTFSKTNWVDEVDCQIHKKEKVKGLFFVRRGQIVKVGLFGAKFGRKVLDVEKAVQHFESLSVAPILCQL